MIFAFAACPVTIVSLMYGEKNGVRVRVRVYDRVRVTAFISCLGLQVRIVLGLEHDKVNDLVGLPIVLFSSAL